MKHGDKLKGMKGTNYFIVSNELHVILLYPELHNKIIANKLNFIFIFLRKSKL